MDKLWYTETYMHTGEYHSIVKKKWKGAICNNVGRPRGFPGGSDSKESSCNAGDLGLIPGLGRSPGEGNGNLLQYSCLENPMDRGAWLTTVHRVTKSQTPPKWLRMHALAHKGLPRANPRGRLRSPSKLEPLPNCGLAQVLETLGF